MPYFDDQYEEKYLYTNPLKPVIKVPESHYLGISYLRHHFPGVFPPSIRSYYDPFLGDGSMYFNISATDKYVNDYSLELITLYELVRDRDKMLRNYLQAFADMWDLLENLADHYSVRMYKDGDDEGIARRIEHNRQTLEHVNFADDRSELLVDGLKVTTVSRIRRFRRAEYEEGELGDDERRVYLESAFKMGLYEHVRAVYNGLGSEVTTLKVACYYFLRRYCLGGMFRKNGQGHFTTPFGGVAVNPLTPDIEIDYWYNTDLTSHLMSTEFESADYLDFLAERKPGVDDFVFLNPPRQMRTSAFTDSPFTYSDHTRLADWLTSTKSMWMMFLRPNRWVEDLYKKKRGVKTIDINYFDNDFQSRFFCRSQSTGAILIKNY